MWVQVLEQLHGRKMSAVFGNNEGTTPVSEQEAIDPEDLRRLLKYVDSHNQAYELHLVFEPSTFVRAYQRRGLSIPRNLSTVDVTRHSEYLQSIREKVGGGKVSADDTTLRSRKRFKAGQVFQARIEEEDEVDPQKKINELEREYELITDKRCPLGKVVKVRLIKMLFKHSNMSKRAISKYLSVSQGSV